jgi:hypothetical protein
VPSRDAVGEAPYRFDASCVAGNPNTRFTRLPNVQSEGGARRAGGALGGRGIVIPPRDRSTGSTAHAIQRRQVGGSHKPARDTATAPETTANGIVCRSSPT